MASRLLSYALSFYGLSDPGLVRPNNEDVLGFLENFFVVADGMGGHQAGEVAARETVIFLCSHMRKLLENVSDTQKSPQNTTQMISTAIEAANQFVYEMSLSHELLKGMGTTLCCLYFHDEYVIYAHVGDSRIYRLRDQQLAQLTEDHALLRELIACGEMQQYSQEGYLYKNVITKAIGTEPDVEPTVNAAMVAPNDLYVLCSDGLSDLLSIKDMELYLNQSHTVEEKVRSLIHAAKRKGGYDNVTVVLVEVARQIGA